MQPFEFVRAESLQHAISASRHPNSSILAGGTELLNWLRIGIRRPERIVDINGIAALRQIERREDRLWIGALTTLSDVADHPHVGDHVPVLREAIQQSASSQLRNIATIGGNPLQLPRCAYFRADNPIGCNRREPNSGCSALDGSNERHAIFGWQDFCVATQPSDPAVALVALDATVLTLGPNGQRAIKLNDFYHYSPSEPQRFNVLEDGEMILGYELPRSAPQSAYLKIRERTSYEFALVSCAVALTVDNNKITTARVALGSVAHKPWRMPEIERSLDGIDPRSARVVEAVEAGMRDARPLSGNAYKIKLAHNAAIRTIRLAGEVA
jgi:xanthine dehydrogenase YagS FAD-binding subunit